jgi:hypothetical protein
MAFYLVPQDRKLAEIFYRAAVEKIGWNDSGKTVRSLPDPRSLLLGVVLSREFGDSQTHANLSAYVEKHYEPGFDPDTGEFGWGFQFGERYPRGQLNALLIMAETGRENSWWNVYNRPNLSKFDQPTLEGVDYPALGISQALYYQEDSALHIGTYAGSQGDRGANTSFRITTLPADAAIRVRCNGQNCEHWQRLSPSSVRIDSQIADRSFEILISKNGKSPQTAGKQPDGGATYTATGSEPRSVSRRRAAQPSTRAINAASSRLVSQPTACPCCST